MLLEKLSVVSIPKPLSLVKKPPVSEATKALIKKVMKPAGSGSIKPSIGRR